MLTLYVRDEQLSGNCPLPRHRLAELTSVLKAVTLLVATLKSSNLAAVHQRTWQQVNTNDALGWFQHRSVKLKTLKIRICSFWV